MAITLFQQITNKTHIGRDACGKNFVDDLFFTMMDARDKKNKDELKDWKGIDVDCN